MESIIKIAGPFIAALVAFLSATRAFFWFSEKLEGFVSKKIRLRLIERLEGWWNYIKNTSTPKLAQEECKVLIAKIVSLQKKDFVSLKITVSFLLTTSAFFFGRVIFFLAKNFDFKFSNLSVLSSESTYYAGDVSYFYLIWLIPDLFLIYYLYRLLFRSKDRRTFLMLYLFRYSVVSFGVSFLLGFDSFYELVALVPNTIGLLLVVYWYKIGSKFIKLDRTLSKRFVYSAIGFLVVLAILMNFTDNLDAEFLLSMLYSDSFFYASNFLFDSITFTITFWILQRIATSNSITNLGYLLLDIVLALLLAVALYVIVLILGNIIDELSILRKIAREDSLSYLDYFRNKLGVYIENVQLGGMLFAATTLIPTIVYITILILSYFGKVAYLFSGKLSKFFFYKELSERKKSPVYMTMVFFSLLIATIPGYIAWHSSKVAIQSIF